MVTPVQALEHYALHIVKTEALHAGLVNRSFLLVSQDGERYVLQQVNPLFAPVVHNDIETVTRHLQTKGVVTPRLLPTKKGTLYAKVGQEIWRVLTYIEGVNRETISSPDQAQEAGRLLGRFHRALFDLDYRFQNIRPNVHNTEQHLAFLAKTLERHEGRHPSHKRVKAHAERLFENVQTLLSAIPKTRPRIVHGDPKASNLIFDREGTRAIAFVDLDTFAHMPLAWELAVALQSWCHAPDPGQGGANFAIEHLGPAIHGYASEARGITDVDEIESIVPCLGIIFVELAARFLADALNESYFQWDPTRFASQSEHNENRAQEQLDLYLAFSQHQPEAKQAVSRAFGSTA